MGNATSSPCTPELNQLSIDIDGDAASDNSGRSVYLSSDGMRVAIGAPQNFPFTSNVSIYEWNGTSRYQLGANIDGENCGWMLREVSKKNMDTLRDFLNK